MRVKRLDQVHWVRIKTTRSGDERTNHEATVPLNVDPSKCEFITTLSSKVTA